MNRMSFTFALIGSVGCQAAGQGSTVTTAAPAAPPTVSSATGTVTSPSAAASPAPSPGATALPVDAARLARATVVLRVERIAVLGADKYGWELVRPLEVFKNESGFAFEVPLRVAHYSWKPGVPEGISTVY